MVFLTGPGPIRLEWSACLSWGSSYRCISSTGTTSVHHHPWPLHWCWGQTQVCMLTQQAFYWVIFTAPPQLRGHLKVSGENIFTCSCCWKEVSSSQPFREKGTFPVCLVGVTARKPGGHDSQLVEASIETFPEIIRSAKRCLELKELNSTITQHGKKTHLSISGPNQFFKSNTFLNQPRKLYAS